MAENIITKMLLIVTIEVSANRNEMAQSSLGGDFSSYRGQFFLPHWSLCRASSYIGAQYGGQYIDLCDASQRLPLKNPMIFKELLSTMMEDDTANLDLNNNEIIAVLQEAEEEENDNQEKRRYVTNPTNRVVFRRKPEMQKSLRTMATVQTTIGLWLASN
ncbi:hypothetical protein Plhal304r1_c015g0056371 [Plasmopara halstedii]